MLTNLAKLRVILLDRDGVINQEPGPILCPEDFIMIPRSAAAIARINDIGFLCFVITNQSAFARGNLTKENFQKITKKMYSELEDFGASIDGQYVCPHHPEWENGIRRTIFKLCSCRKPGTLLIEKAAKENNFSPKEAVLIGDSPRDFEAAARWGIISIGVKTGHSSEASKYSFQPDYWQNDLWEAIDFLLEGF
tara:strand:+ start:11366 stop:11947 length:582 start_codon:yes stop_codon:yes gene_type:complete